MELKYYNLKGEIVLARKTESVKIFHFKLWKSNSYNKIYKLFFKESAGIA